LQLEALQIIVIMLGDAQGSGKREKFVKMQGRLLNSSECVDALCSALRRADRRAPRKALEAIAMICDTSESDLDVERMAPFASSIVDLLGSDICRNPDALVSGLRVFFGILQGAHAAEADSTAAAAVFSDFGSAKTVDSLVELTHHDGKSRDEATISRIVLALDSLRVLASRDNELKNRIFEHQIISVLLRLLNGNLEPVRMHTLDLLSVLADGATAEQVQRLRGSSVIGLLKPDFTTREKGSVVLTELGFKATTALTNLINAAGADESGTLVDSHDWSIGGLSAALLMAAMIFWFVSTPSRSCSFMAKSVPRRVALGHSTVAGKTAPPTGSWTAAATSESTPFAAAKRALSPRERAR
jgi:hypothetical protein